MAPVPSGLINQTPTNNDQLERIWLQVFDNTGSHTGRYGDESFGEYWTN